jgi:hypothetical protein
MAGLRAHRDQLRFHHHPDPRARQKLSRKGGGQPVVSHLRLHLDPSCHHGVRVPHPTARHELHLHRRDRGHVVPFNISKSNLFQRKKIVSY